MFRKTIVIILLSFVSLPTFAYIFGVKSFNGSWQNIEEIENKYDVYFPVIGYIFDPWTENSIYTMERVAKYAGPFRILHITISPAGFSAKQVAEGAFDKEYKELFQIIKNNNLRVVFRTMHEMNGGRYSWCSDPENFKLARIHVRNLSREIGLDKKNILFSFSSNHWDMPTKELPTQTAKLIPCRPGKKEELDCYTFEDYYPGDEYVDIMGITFYNWGKATTDRQRLKPETILNEKGRDPLQRRLSFKKPIFIDEVGTTSVFYTSGFDFKISQNIYNNDDGNLKNGRLLQLATALKKYPEIVGALYFNTDYTNGLERKLLGEADWAIINLSKDKFYAATYDLLAKQDSHSKYSRLYKMFEARTPFTIPQRKDIKLAKKIYAQNSGNAIFIEKIESIMSGGSSSGTQISPGVLSYLYHLIKINK